MTVALRCSHGLWRAPPAGEPEPACEHGCALQRTSAPLSGLRPGLGDLSWVRPGTPISVLGARVALDPVADAVIRDMAIGWMYERLLEEDFE